VPEVFENLEHEVTIAARQVEQLIPCDVGLGPLVVMVVHLDPVSAGRRHRLPMKAAVLNIREFDFNYSRFHRLDGDCLLDNIQFQVESITIHIVFSVYAACVHLAPVAAAFTGLSAPPLFFRHGMAKKPGEGALMDR
jgi:hypothetical protein